jgi:hypothetical protein
MAALLQTGAHVASCSRPAPARLGAAHCFGPRPQKHLRAAQRSVKVFAEASTTNKAGG